MYWTEHTDVNGAIMRGAMGGAANGAVRETLYSVAGNPFYLDLHISQGKRFAKYFTWLAFVRYMIFRLAFLCLCCCLLCRFRLLV